MSWERYKYLLIFFTFILIASFSITVFITSKKYFPQTFKPINIHSNGLSEDSNLKDILKVQRFYSTCGHFEELEPINILLKGNKISIENLMPNFPPQDGWALEYAEGKWIATQTVDGLCTLDGEKRHLRVIEEFVAVYQGPSIYEDNLLFITNISIWNLPENWSQAILSGEACYNSEQELLEALDSLDEFEMSF